MTTSPTPHQLRAPCVDCGSTNGTIETKSNQDVVRCECGRHAYNAPRTETGREVRSLRSRPNVKPSVRARIIEQYGLECAFCHRRDRPLQVDHFIPLALAEAVGAEPGELDGDWNLVALCDECNSGKSNHPPTIRTWLLVMRCERMRREVGGAA